MVRYAASFGPKGGAVSGRESLVEKALLDFFRDGHWYFLDALSVLLPFREEETCAALRALVARRHVTALPIEGGIVYGVVGGEPLRAERSCLGPLLAGVVSPEEGAGLVEVLKGALRDAERMAKENASLRQENVALRAMASALEEG